MMQGYQEKVRLFDRINALPNPRHVDLPETLLDRIEEAQLQISDVKEDISLLKTQKEALDLISKNLSKIRRLVHEKHRYSDCDSILNIFNARVNTLVRVIEHLAKKSFNGCGLFDNKAITLKSCPEVDFYLETSEIPTIEGIETNDIESTLVSLDEASTVINQQYRRIDRTLKHILDYYHRLKEEFDVLILAQAKLHLVDSGPRTLRYR